MAAKMHEAIPTNSRANQTANRPRNEAFRTREAVLVLGNSACPRAYGAKRVRVRIREKEGFKHRWFWRAPCFWGAKNLKTARWVNLRAMVLKAFSLLRFFVALDKEMTCRHAQWLTVIKRIANSSRPLTLKAATRHQLRPLTPQVSQNPTPRPPARATQYPPAPYPSTPARPTSHRALQAVRNPAPPA